MWVILKAVKEKGSKDTATDSDSVTDIVQGKVELAVVEGVLRRYAGSD